VTETEVQDALMINDPHDQLVIAYHLIIDNRRIWNEGSVCFFEIEKKNQLFFQLEKRKSRIFSQHQVRRTRRLFQQL